MLASSCALDRRGVPSAPCTATASCSADRECVDGHCVTRVDAGPGRDASSDGALPLNDAAADAHTDGSLHAHDGGPGHCHDGVEDGDETDADCGGSCAPCDSCQRCEAGPDCATGGCVEGRCAATLSTIVTPSGSTLQAFVRDGAVLLAHYAPGSFHRAYDPHVNQRMDASGGSVPPPGWAPDPCHESGHIDFRSVAPAGRSVRFECSNDLGEPSVAVGGALFDSFEFGDYGTVGAAGAPGWAMIAAIGSGRGRSFHGACGSTLSVALGGIAYCDGVPDSYSNHIVSYTVSAAGSPSVGCGGTGCSGVSCGTHVWVWADLP